MKALQAWALVGPLALAACSTPAGSSRECSFARPIILSHRSIAGLDPEDAQAILKQNRQIVAMCHTPVPGK